MRRRVLWSIGMACLVGVCPGSVRATVESNMCRVLREHAIRFDSNAVRRAAIEGMLRAVDPRGYLLESDTPAEAPAEPPEIVFHAWDDGIAYLDPGPVYDGVATQVFDRLQQWDPGEGGRKGLILDIRDSGGTDLPSVDALAGAFFPERTPLYDVCDRQGRAVETHRAVPSPFSVGSMPVVLLVGSGTRDAAETLAVSLKAAGGVILMGAPTFGDASVREVVSFPTGERMMLATHRVVPVSGAGYDSTGVAPDLVVEPSGTVPREAGDGVDRDPVVRRAREVLRGLAALGMEAPSPPPYEEPPPIVQTNTVERSGKPPMAVELPEPPTTNALEIAPEDK